MIKFPFVPHHLFPKNIAVCVCRVNSILDAIISLASNVCVQKATLSAGVSINHVITIFIALFVGWLWEALGIENLFMVSAVPGLCSSAYAATIKAKNVCP